MNVEIKTNLQILVRILIAAVIAFGIEQILSVIFGAEKWRPSALAVIVIYSGFYYGSAWGIIAGFVIALMYSCVILCDSGLLIISWITIGYLSGKMKRYLFFEKFRASILPLIIALIFEIVLYELLERLFLTI